MKYLVIPVLAVSVWPLYAWASRASAARRPIRIALGVVFGVAALSEGCVGVTGLRALPEDRTRFDDALSALVLYGAALLLLSLAVLLVGELVLAIGRRLPGPRAGL